LITLAAGFAGTVSFPSAYFLTEFFGWRVAILIFAATVAFICLPLIFYGSYFASLQSKTHAPKASRTVSDALSIAKTQTFWFIGITFFLISINHGIIISHMLPIFYERGLDAGLAVLMASLIGPMQVAGRVMMMAFEKRVSVFAICMACFMAIFVAGWALYFGGMGLGLIGIFVVLQGAGYGVLSIIRPTVIAELLGRRDFGVIAGLLAVGFVIGTALAPTLGSFLWIFGDYDLVIAFTICIPLFALVSLVLAWRYQSDNSTNQ
jgi:cyanate permease